MTAHASITFVARPSRWRLAIGKVAVRLACALHPIAPAVAIALARRACDFVMVGAIPRIEVC